MARVPGDFEKEKDQKHKNTKVVSDTSPSKLSGVVLMMEEALTQTLQLQ
jgi:hypothetical protein